MGEVLKVGSIAIDRLDTGISIHGETEKDLYNTVEFPVGTPYQVPVDTILRIGCINYQGTAVKTKIIIGYGDDIVALSATPPANNIELIAQLPVAVANELNCVEIIIYIPTGKYPYIISSIGDSAVILNGIRVDT